MERGFISIQTLIFIILVIVGVIISSIVYLNFAFPGTTDKETCHASVIVRSLPVPAIDIKDFIPLNCRTQKYCITAGFFSGNCKEEFKGIGRIEKVKVDSKEQIEEVITKEMFDCWTMMGEGKTLIYSKSFADKYGLGDVASNCVICSRIAFDENSLTKNTKITIDDLKSVTPLNYMLSHKVPDSNVSYYKYFGGAATSLPVQISEEEKQAIEKDKEELGFSDNIKENLQSDPYSELAILYMQISAPTHMEAYKNIAIKVAAIGGATAGVIGPITTLKLLPKAGSGLVAVCGGPIRGVVCAAILIAAGGYQYGSVSDNMAIAAQYCGDITTGDDARNGCSVVRVVNYNITQIKEYCEVIESKT